MRSIAILLIALATLLAGPASAQVLSVQSWVEEWDEAAQVWVRIDMPVEAFAARAERYVAPVPAAPLERGIASYGPFRVLDGSRAALVDATDSATPAQFATMLRDYPALGVLEMVECPGTDDDVANLKLGRMIRAAGLETRVPRGGSVRSGAVELFLAGATRSVEDGAEFAVHAWLDEYGRQPGDYAGDAAANRNYLAYYREMGMAADQASAFYDMTNSVPHEQALWLTAQDMRQWLGESIDGASTVDVASSDAPQLAYLDLSTAFN